MKKVLSEQIKEQLIEDLMKKRYEVGDKLVERALAKRFCVFRPVEPVSPAKIFGIV